MAWNINYGALQTAIGSGNAPAAPAAPPAPAPAAPPAYNWNATLPGNSGGSAGAAALPPAPVSTSAGGGGSGGAGDGEISVALEQMKLNAAQQAAYQAYLNAKVQQDSEQVAINKAVAAGNQAYQQAQIALQGQQLTTTRQQAYNQGMAEFEHSGVATGGRIAGLNALRAPPAAVTMAGQDFGSSGGNPTGVGLPATSTMSRSPYSVAEPNTQGAFGLARPWENSDPGVAHAFMRSDMRFGLSNTASDFTPQAIQGFLAGVGSGRYTVGGAFGQQLLSRLQAGTITPDQLAALSPSIGPGGARSPGALASGGSF